MQFLTTAELAGRWRCSVGYLANLRCIGRGIPFVRVGTKVLYPLSEVEKYESDALVPQTLGSRSASDSGRAVGGEAGHVEGAGSIAGV